MRVVFDTNIYVSAFGIPGGRAEETYLGALRGRFELFTSIPILTETATVLQSKFDWAEQKTRELVQAISRVAIVVRTASRLRVVEDEPDNRILECAVHTHADFVVTGDRHLLTLGTYKGIQLIRLTDFLELLASEEQAKGSEVDF
ncbi:MAG TPA: putative toxin-antitoxin system toxin component, PIN family [Nitrospiraceae bacterium]|nr:putative toxin-antitoxin system toxin component, PIN family [Nitrospiraceae bacterium]